MKECPSCRAKIKGNPLTCQECGASLDKETEYICTNCDQHFFGKRNACPHCGSTNIYQKLEYITE